VGARLPRPQIGCFIIRAESPRPCTSDGLARIREISIKVWILVSIRVQPKRGIKKPSNPFEHNVDKVKERLTRASRKKEEAKRTFSATF
jgi:hypothetical protein